MYRTRIGLIAASVLLVVASLFISGTNMVDGVISRMETASARQQTEFYDKRWEIARARMPQIPAEPVDIKTAVEMAGQLRAYKTTPRAMIATLSEGLVDFPQIKLDSINWVASTDPDRAVGGRAANVRTSANIEAGGTHLYQLADIKGKVDPFDGDYRQALALVRRFAATLLGLPDVEAVAVLKQPLDVTSDAALQGNTEVVADVAPFEMRIVLRDKSNEGS